MEPSTPSRASSRRDIPATPMTPRFGTFEDLPDRPGDVRDSLPHKHTTAHHRAAPSETPRRKRHANTLATPRQTPRKRQAVQTPLQSEKLNLRGRESIFRDPTEISTADEAESDSDEPAAAVSEPRTPARIHFAESEEDTQSADSASEQLDFSVEENHPHREHPPPDVPGVWYVFRGKRIFRPLPPGEKPIEPMTLFKSEIASQKRPTQPTHSVSVSRQPLHMREAAPNAGDSGSEADTEVEW